MTNESARHNCFLVTNNDGRQTQITHERHQQAKSRCVRLTLKSISYWCFERFNLGGKAVQINRDKKGSENATESNFRWSRRRNTAESLSKLLSSNPVSYKRRKDQILSSKSLRVSTTRRVALVISHISPPNTGVDLINRHRHTPHRSAIIKLIKKTTQVSNLNKKTKAKKGAAKEVKNIE